MSEKHYIYCYTNKINGKKYIGRTINMKQRIRQHRTSYNKVNTTFSSAIKKYGIESFEVTILEETTSPQERETYYIQTFDTLIPRGYNMKEFDMDMTQEIRDKISKNGKGKVRSEEHKKAISNAQLGVKKTTEHRQLISQSHIGIVHTDETKKKLSEMFSKNWIITHPDGTEEQITNLNAFCKLHNLNQGNMANVASGKKLSCKGYKVRPDNTKQQIISWLNSNKITFDYTELDNSISIKIDGRTFTIFEHEWQNRKTQIQNFLLGSLNRNHIKIYARNCDIVIYDEINKNTMKFFDDYHIQGRPKSYETCITLVHKDEIVGAMSFGKHHRQGNDDVDVLTRLCWKTGYCVVGGSARMFSYRPKYKNVVSWSDNRWSDLGGVYQRLGFELETTHKPDYHYINSSGQVKSKQSMQKRFLDCKPGQTELSRATELGWRRFYDSGKKKWIFKQEGLWEVCTLHR